MSPEAVPPTRLHHSPCGNRIALAILRITLLSWCFCLFVLTASASDVSSDSTQFQYDESKDSYVYSTSIQVENDQSVESSAIQELPAFITTISLDPNLPRFQTLPDLLSGSVGISVRDFGGLGKFSTVSIRGSSSNQVLVLLDGVRLNTSSDANVDLANIPLATIDRIEVLRGADSAVFGDGAVGGVINLISRKSAQPGIQLGGFVKWGSFSTLETGLDTHLNQPRLLTSFQLFYSGSDGDFRFNNDNGTETNSQDDFKDVRINNAFRNIGGRLWWSLPEQDPWSVSGHVETIHSTKGVPGMVTFPSGHAEQTDRRISGTVRFKRANLFHDNSDITVDLAGHRTGLDFDDPEGEQIGVPVHTHQRTDSWNGTAASRFGYARGNGSVSLHFLDERLQDPDFNSPDRRSWSVSGKNDMNIGTDSFWVTAIARYDRISDVGDRFSPKLGVRWFIMPELSLKSNAGAAFRSPSFNELYMNTGFITGNPDLQAEKGRSYDLGISWESSRFRAECAAFLMDTDDLIQYILLSGFRYKPFNIGRVRSRGTELDISWAVSDSVRISTSYTWMEAIDRTDDRNYRGRQIPGKPEHDLFTRLEWNIHFLNWFAEWHYIGGNYLTRSGTKWLPDRQTGNLGVSVVMTEWIQMGLEVKNVTSDDVVDVRGFPLPPRSYFAGITFRY